MDDDPPVIRCPACGSTLTSPLPVPGMWECRYHLCRLVFPICPVRDRDQLPITAEEEPSYRWNPAKD